MVVLLAPLVKTTTKRCPQKGQTQLVVPVFGVGALRLIEMETKGPTPHIRETTLKKIGHAAISNMTLISVLLAPH